jgi:hypothetical protein
LINELFARLFGPKHGAVSRAADGWWADQRNQNVARDQYNVASVAGNLNIGPRKVPPHIERFTYRIDRGPQCEALLACITGAKQRNRPICAIAFGIEDDLPNTVGTSLFEYVQGDVLHTCRLRPFLPPKSPLCLPWPDTCLDSDSLWMAVGRFFLDLETLGTLQDIRSELQNRTGSIAFGFEMDVAAWERHEPTLTSWIGSLRGYASPPQGVALAVVVLSGPKSSAERLTALHLELDARYAGDDTVLVLPPLEPVERREFKEWHRRLVVLAADSLSEGDLATMLLKLFPDDAVAHRMGEIWDPVRTAVHKAWAGA